MPKTVIKRRMSLDFLGDEYKDAYFVFETVPVTEYEQMVNDDKEAGQDRIKSTMIMFERVKSKFVTGKFPDENGELFDVTKEDFSVDEGTLVKCFQFITGQLLDPKE